MQSPQSENPCNHLTLERQEGGNAGAGGHKLDEGGHLGVETAPNEAGFLDHCHRGFG